MMKLAKGLTKFFVRNFKAGYDFGVTVAESRTTGLPVDWEEEFRKLAAEMFAAQYEMAPRFTRWHLERVIKGAQRRASLALWLKDRIDNQDAKEALGGFAAGSAAASRQMKECQSRLSHMGPRLAMYMSLQGLTVPLKMDEDVDLH